MFIYQTNLILQTKNNNIVLFIYVSALFTPLKSIHGLANPQVKFFVEIKMKSIGGREKNSEKEKKTQKKKRQPYVSIYYLYLEVTVSL